MILKKFIAIDKFMERKKCIVTFFAKIAYIIGCLTLYLIAVWIIFAALYGLFKEVTQETFSVYHLLDEVGLIIFAIAAIDVVKYLADEEIIRGAEKRSEKEEKQSLTKFIVIISTALALEGLVLTIETAKTNIEHLLYPILLLTASAFFIITMAVYKKLTSKAD